MYWITYLLVESQCILETLVVDKIDKAEVSLMARLVVVHQLNRRDLFRACSEYVGFNICRALSLLLYYILCAYLVRNGCKELAHHVLSDLDVVQTTQPYPPIDLTVNKINQCWQLVMQLLNNKPISGL